MGIKLNDFIILTYQTIVFTFTGLNKINMLKYLLICCLGIFASNQLLKAQANPTTFIFVRHAEKDNNDPRDPDLSAAGKQRAAWLATFLSKVEIKAVYTTPLKRTRQTVTPFAQQKNLEVKDYNAQDPLLLKKWAKTHAGQTILVAGHSNSVPEYLNQLTGTKNYQQLDENEYDKIFIVTFNKYGKAQVMTLTVPD